MNTLAGERKKASSNGRPKVPISKLHRVGRDVLFYVPSEKDEKVSPFSSAGIIKHTTIFIRCQNRSEIQYKLIAKIDFFLENLLAPKVSNNNWLQKRLNTIILFRSLCKL